MNEIVLGNYRWSRTDHGDWSIWTRTEPGSEWVYDGLADAYQVRLIMEIVRMRGAARRTDLDTHVQKSR